MPRFADPHLRTLFKRELARTLRADATDAERKLWALLRDRRLAGWRFRRQQPIGPYIVDFFCARAKLVIELDGDQHGTDGARVYDLRRTTFLEGRGYRVLRFPNHQVMRDCTSALDVIIHGLETHPPLEGGSKSA